MVIVMNCTVLMMVEKQINYNKYFNIKKVERVNEDLQYSVIIQN